MSELRHEIAKLRVVVTLIVKMESLTTQTKKSGEANNDGLEAQER